MSRRPGGRRRRLHPILLATAVASAFVVLALGSLVVGRGPVATSSSAGQRNGTAERVPRFGEVPSTSVEASGRLLIPLDGGLSVVGLPSGDVADLVPSEPTGAVSGARWSPAGRGVAYALYHVRTGDSSASSEIYLTEPDAEPRLLVGRDKPGSVMEGPAWGPDGRILYFGSITLENQSVVRRVEQVDVVDGGRRQLLNGMLPDGSPDGQQLAVVQADRYGDSLVIVRPDGSEPRTLIPSGRYSALGGARFSPDGRTLAVPISGTAGEVRQAASSLPWSVLGSGLAHAHGEPWEVYLLPVEGGEPRRLTNLVEDEISVAWSPEGDKVAIYGSRGLYVVDREGRAALAIDRGGYGGIDWAR